MDIAFKEVIKMCKCKKVSILPQSYCYESTIVYASLKIFHHETFLALASPTTLIKFSILNKMVRDHSNIT